MNIELEPPISDVGKGLVASGDEEGRLHELGYSQELRREFSLLTLGSLCLSLMSSWEALSVALAPAIITGGAPSVACSLAEIASVYPTAGGQYHWVAILSPRPIRSFASWFTGWISIGGQAVFTASAAFASGLQMQGYIVLNNKDYIPERYQAMLLVWLTLVYAIVINIWGHQLQPKANLLAAALHIAAWVAVIIVLAVMAPKNDARYDSTCHLAEEIPKPSRNVPLAMVGSCVLNGIMGLGYVILLLYSTGPLKDLLATPTGFPFMEIYLHATRSPIGATMMCLSFTIIAVVATGAATASTSRTLWAFARDGATPLHHQISKVDNATQVPVLAILIVVTLQALLGFIYLGNTTAYNAILAMAAIGMYLSYLLPIACMLSYRLRKTHAVTDGEFRLGQPFGVCLNVVSISWLTVAIIFSAFPSELPVTPQNANYSSAVMIGWILFGAVYYFGWGL
ncbi:hypothetical protein FE257_006016 [Aspergillus nanangensis]|uniref:Amino acid permease n=1 Tax=Aspergillus nanangensis TaxID=2582783 RepID=A0AAD4GV59_ASPNN|nr:hypothetical protein FE257_006016 [Aspergillus nanangensis]